jgi:hypothetical protein
MLTVVAGVSNSEASIGLCGQCHWLVCYGQCCVYAGTTALWLSGQGMHTLSYTILLVVLVFRSVLGLGCCLR